MNRVRTITARELKRSLDAGQNRLLLDVQLDEFYEAAHLPHARNACVYQVVFVDEVSKLAPNKSTPLIVYGSSARSLASSSAAHKLASAGYRNVLDFRGGIDEWRKAGFVVEGTSQTPRLPPLSRGTYQVDPNRSMIEWAGRNLANKHHGTVRVASGKIIVQRGRVTGGQFVIDMASIVNADIPDKSYAQLLVQHLLSDDFFDAANHPTAQFVIAGARPVSHATPGTPNYAIRGRLTIKGIERSIAFPAMIGVTAEGDLAAQANFDLDRTRWNVLYGSGRFFENLGKHLVNDLISLQIKLVATGRS
jgi:polyisoprenoid-binding protein YceI